MELNEILQVGTSQGASDIHLRVGLPPMLRINGTMVALPNATRLTPEDTLRYASALMNKEQKARFAENLELDLAYGPKGLGRFRVNVFRQRRTLALVFRTIPDQVPSFAQLNLPQSLEAIAEEQRGLILVTGTTGSGKSTTVAAIIDYINTQRSAHILTIEDPIEFLHRDKKAVITQREVGNDTPGFAAALRSALRQDPDVILVGEMRDRRTVEIALAAAETGHLVISTLHTVNAAETIYRIASLFPTYQVERIRFQLSGLLKAIISQRLVPRADGQGRIPALEVLINRGQVQEYIEDKSRTREITDAIARGASTYGTQSFDQSLYRSYKDGLITLDDAMLFATNPDQFAMRVRGVVSAKDNY